MNCNNLSDIFLQLFTEKNSDGTRNLRLRGRELFLRKGFRIEDGDMSTIASYLKEHDMVIKLDLCYNNIGDIGIEIFADEYLQYPNNLQILNLVGCNIGPNGILALSKVKATLNLKTLRLTGNKIGSQGGQYASTLIGPDSVLKHLDVGDCDQTLGSLPFFTSQLRSDIGYNKSLQVLDLSRLIPLGCMYRLNGEQLAYQLADALKMNDTLIELHIQRNEMDCHDIELLMTGLVCNKTLLMLDLGYNRIGDVGLELITNWIRTRPSLLGLNVAGNNIGNHGAHALSFGLPFSKVRLLDLSHNHIGDDGMVPLFISLRKPYLLRFFFIWGNKLGQKSLHKLSKLLLATTLTQESIDVKLYKVDNVFQIAHYPADTYKHRYYCVLDHGVPVQLRIRRNKIDPYYSLPRIKCQFVHRNRIPPIDYGLKPREPSCCLVSKSTRKKKRSIQK